MAPTDLGRKPCFGVGRIVDHQIGAIDQFEDVFVGLARYMLRVGDVADRLALELDTVSGGAIGMVKHRRADADLIADLKGFAGVEIDEAQFRFKCLNGHREHWIGHLPRDDFIEPALLLEVSGHQRELMLGMKRRSEERKAGDVIPMGVGKQQRRFVDALAEISVAQVADSGIGIEDDLLAARIHLQATCVAAKGDMVRGRAGDAAANTPKFELKTH